MSEIVKRPADVTWPRSDALDIALGAGAVAAETALWFANRLIATGRPVVRAFSNIPLLPGSMQPDRVMQQLLERGRRERALRTIQAKHLLEVLTPKILAAVLDQIDITSLVRDHVNLNALIDEVDLNEIVGRIDLNEIASNLDLDAIIGRLDLATLVEQVLNDIDLPEIIRESTGAMSSDIVRGVRMQSINADKALTGIMDRVLGRRRRTDAETQTSDASETPDSHNSDHGGGT